jgi:hypothetical protein
MSRYPHSPHGAISSCIVPAAVAAVAVVAVVAVVVGESIEEVPVPTSQGTVLHANA